MHIQVSNTAKICYPDPAVAMNVTSGLAATECQLSIAAETIFDSNIHGIRYADFSGAK